MTGRLQNLRRLFLAGALALLPTGCEQGGEPGSSGPVVKLDPVDPVAAIEAECRRLDETVWAEEIEAQGYEDYFIRLSDALRTQADHGRVLANLGFQRLVLPEFHARAEPRHGLLSYQFSGSTTSDSNAWVARIAGLQRRGFVIKQTEWYHENFTHSKEGPPRSTVAMVLHVTQESQQKRFIVTADLDVAWGDSLDRDGYPKPEEIVVSNLVVLERQGEPAFEPRMLLDPLPHQSGRIQPVVVHDFDRNGHADIFLAGCNKIYWNQGDWKFVADSLLTYPITGLRSVIVADFNGDGIDDVFGASADDYPLLWRGSAEGRFDEPPTMTRLREMLRLPQVITCGDIDADGDLDVWLSQYKAPFLQGQMPTPYYDALDGHPSFLLRNDGTGKFSDATATAGLAAKRYRRTYSCSFFDYDNDGDLDLLTVNDFSRVEIHQNDGTGSFREVTSEAIDEPANFGMAHAIADFDLDANLDLFVNGMSSVVARRLERMGLGRDEFPMHQEARASMSYGNRLYLGSGDGQYAMAPFANDVAHSQWSWGVTAADFDNDRDVDIYIANGHQTRKTAKDISSRYWCHDIYMGTSQPDENLSRYFQNFGMQVMGAGVSWDGFQHNHFFVNEGGQGFFDAGFLMGVAFEFDAAAVVSEDFDSDGRVDLLVVESGNLNPGTPVGSRVHVLQNRKVTTNHWIGVRLASDASPRSPVGARITVASRDGKQVACIVTGDSFRSQHAWSKHFGLGLTSEVDYIEVRWPDGTHQRISRPGADQYHAVAAPP